MATFKVSRGAITWSLAVPLAVVLGVWGCLLTNRIRRQHAAVAALQAVPTPEPSVCVLPARGGGVRAIGMFGPPPKAPDPIEFVPHGPEWLRACIGEERCRAWIDTPVAVRLTRYLSEEDDLAAIASLTRLERLELSGVSDAGLSALRGLMRLDSLSVTSGVTDEGVDHLAVLPNLRFLELRACSISDVGLEKLTRSARLEELRIYSSHITARGLSTLRDMHSLKRLTLGGLQGLTDRGLYELAQLRQLEYLDVRGVRDMTAQDGRGLAAACPWMTVVWQRPYPW